MLTVSELRKSFCSPTRATIQVLSSVSFSATPGEAVAITGASGAGKSTLLHIIGGLEEPDSGTVRLDDVTINTSPAVKLAQPRNSNLGFIFQFHHLLQDLSARENVALPLMIARVSQREALDRAAQALERLGLGDRVEHPVTYLSGGEQQRVAVCRALIAEPKLVLADEPTGNLDSVIEEEISSQLVNYAREQTKILVVATHNLRLAGMCDRVMRLENGELNML